MISTYEQTYKLLIEHVLQHGETRETRNGRTKSVFGMSLVVSGMSGGLFPILQGRKMYPRPVLGELAAMLRCPTHIDDFRYWGCNYWDKWADKDGNITIDYGNAWASQIPALKDALANDPTSRRMLITGWIPENLPTLSLPCCHYSYQFYVSHNSHLDMLWTQRSADMMIGLPSDVIFAAAWLIAVANEFGYTPGSIKLDLGDCHIYEEHTFNAHRYIKQLASHTHTHTTYEYLAPPGADFLDFDPDYLKLSSYTHAGRINFELKQ